MDEELLALLMDTSRLPDLLKLLQERYGQSPATQAALLREIFGNPWRPVIIVEKVKAEKLCDYCDGRGYILHDMMNDPRPVGCEVCGGRRRIVKEIERPAKWLTDVLSWNDRAVPRLAAAIYDERAFDRMPILADALEDAGCADEEILNHCRGLEWCLELWPRHGNPVYVGTHSRYGPLTHSKSCGCKGTGWVPLRGPHVRGCLVLDLLLGKE